MPKPFLLPPVQRALYLEHGGLLASYDLPVQPFAKRIGATEWSIRRVVAHLTEFGPPTENDLTWRVVVLPDAHFDPEHGDPRRARLFGLEIARQHRIAETDGHRFGLVVIGDWAEIGSLSWFDAGKQEEWGRSFQADVLAANDALASMEAVLAQHGVVPERKVVTLGNHDDQRITKYVARHGVLDGTLTWSAIRWEDYGYEVHRFLERARIEDVVFSHYLQDPRTGKATRSVNLARAYLLKHHCSVVVGHHHVYSTATQPTADGRRITATSVGCAFGYSMDWAWPAPNAGYDRGLVVLTGLRRERYTPHFLPLHELRRRYEETQ